MLFNETYMSLCLHVTLNAHTSNTVIGLKHGIKTNNNLLRVYARRQEQLQKKYVLQVPTDDIS